MSANKARKVNKAKVKKAKKLERSENVSRSHIHSPPSRNINLKSICTLKYLPQNQGAPGTPTHCLIPAPVYSSNSRQIMQPSTASTQGFLWAPRSPGPCLPPAPANSSSSRWGSCDTWLLVNSWGPSPQNPSLRTGQSSTERDPFPVGKGEEDSTCLHYTSQICLSQQSDSCSPV